MIRLKSEIPFAQGHYRACYRHPEKELRCLKLLLAGSMPDELRRKAAWIKKLRAVRSFSQNEMDHVEFSKLYERIGSKLLDHLSKVFGIVTTDLGEALETELICDSNDSISSTGHKIRLQCPAWDPVDSAINELSKFCRTHRIFLKDPGVDNIAFQRSETGDLRAKIVDGFSSLPSTVFFKPLRFTHPALAEKKMAKFKSRMHHFYIKDGVSCE